MCSENRLRLRGKELTALGERMAESDKPEEQAALRGETVSGFYGGEAEGRPSDRPTEPDAKPSGDPRTSRGWQGRPADKSFLGFIRGTALPSAGHS